MCRLWLKMTGFLLWRRFLSCRLWRRFVHVPFKRVIVIPRLRFHRFRSLIKTRARCRRVHCGLWHFVPKLGWGSLACVYGLRSSDRLGRVNYIGWCNPLSANVRCLAYLRRPVHLYYVIVHRCISAVTVSQVIYLHRLMRYLLYVACARAAYIGNIVVLRGSIL